MVNSTYRSLGILLSTIVLALHTMGCAPKELPTVLVAESEVLEFKASHQTTREELEQIRLVLKREYGVTFNYSSSTFLEDNRIRDFIYTIGAPGQPTGKAVARLSKLQYNYYGFRLVYDKDGWTVQKIGAM